MVKYLMQFLFLTFLLGTLPCHAQKEANIANTSVRLQGDKVQISYDILNTNPAARFVVSVEITEAQGKKLDVKALDGDVGEVTKAGRNKVIIWDPVADSIFLNATIDIQVYAEMFLPPPPPVVVQEPEPEKHAQTIDPATADPASEDPTSADPTAGDAVSTEFKRAGIMLQSALLPGLGLTRVTGKPHWIKGVAGYGCVAGAIVFNRKAVAFYEDYRSSESHDEANAFFSDMKRQHSISRGFGFVALAIWVTDLTWTFVGTSDRKTGSGSLSRNSFSIDADYDEFSATPLLSFTYTF